MRDCPEARRIGSNREAGNDDNELILLGVRLLEFLCNRCLLFDAS